MEPPEDPCDLPVIQIGDDNDKVFLDDDKGIKRANSKKCVISFDGARYTIGNYLPLINILELLTK